MDGKRPIIASRNGVVAAAHPLAAAAGARILGRGGNAFDAAVAAAAALGVVEPSTSGLAGFGMATCWVAGDRRVRTLAFQPTVPAAFPSGRFRRRAELQAGPASVAAPGNVAGWYNLLSAHGTRTFADALAPAIALARDGVPLVAFATAGINQAAETFRTLPYFPEWSRTYADRRAQVRFGQVLHQPELAATLEAIGANGPRHLYGGRLGESLVAHVHELGGFLSMADLEAMTATWGKSIAVPYRGFAVHAPAPPSQAFEVLLTLRLLDGFDLASMERDGVEHLDTLWRAARLAAAERTANGHPAEHVLEQLLGDEHVERLRTRVADGLPVEASVGEGQGPSAALHTTAVSAADRAGNVVCITQSLGGPFGAGIVVPGTGVCLNNALAWGDPDPDGASPLVAGATLSTPLAPLVALRERHPVLGLGAPVGTDIGQALVQHVDFSLPIQAAVEAPRARLGDGRRVLVEGRVAASVLEALRARGHEIEVAAAWAPQVGGMQGVVLDPKTGVITGGGDPRRDGYVVGA